MNIFQKHVYANFVTRAFALDPNVAMSAVAAETIDQDRCDDVIMQHKSLIINLNTYENVSRNMAVNGKGLAHCAPLTFALIGLWENCYVNFSQIRTAIQNMDKCAQVNKTKLKTPTWASQRAERIVTLFNHLRRLKRDLPRLQQCLNKNSNEGSCCDKKLVRAVPEESLLRRSNSPHELDETDHALSRQPSRALEPDHLRGRSRSLSKQDSNARRIE